MTLNILGAVLLAVGSVAAYLLASPRAGAPAAGWFPDPASGTPRQRFWDSRAWTGHVVEAGEPAALGHRFRGRFWGPWTGYLAGAAVVLVAGAAVYRSTEQIHVLAAASLLSMAGVCWAFYRFVNQQLALDDVVDQLQVLAVAGGAAGATLLIAANINALIIDGIGISTATATVGFVEEGTKFLVPLALFLLGTYRDPRAGVALGMAGGFGFAVAETTQYAYATAAATGPDFCGAATSVTPGSVIQEQVFRIFTVSPLHWLWTGIAVAIAWRLWHLHGRRGTLGAVGGLLMVMVIHSLNDSSATAFCDNPDAQGLAALLRFPLLIVMYVVFRAWTRKSTPPQLIGRVTRAWTPRHLPRPVQGRAPVLETAAGTAQRDTPSDE
ncbi:PrsW family glutamic-type intramembrane protease [Cellulomonas sp. Y8]|uniref:PrsW family glutamic-type intramembrane protease n=1 Tax=Cellulomonas sp. Y8 TaxID=2591145 RepID=UPI003D75E23E